MEKKKKEKLKLPLTFLFLQFPPDEIFIPIRSNGINQTQRWPNAK